MVRRTYSVHLSAHLGSSVEGHLLRASSTTMILDCCRGVRPNMAFHERKEQVEFDGQASESGLVKP